MKENYSALFFLFPLSPLCPQRNTERQHGCHVMSKLPRENLFTSLMLKSASGHLFVFHVTGKKHFDGHEMLPRSMHIQVVPKENCAMITFFAKWLSPKVHLLSSWSSAKHFQFSLKGGPGPTHGFFFFFLENLCALFSASLYYASGNN